MVSRAALGALLAAVVLVACNGRDDSGGAGTVVVATTTHAADLARQVGGDRVEVRGLLRPGADPHDYEPRPSDARAVADAELVVRSGGELDEWLDDLLEGADADAPEVDLLTAVRPPGDDPHWWQDPRNAVRAVSAIRDALIEADPGGRGEYERRTRAYSRRIEALDAAIEECVTSELEPEQRRLVTTHDALGHYAERYGFEVIGAVLPSRTTQAQPSAGETQRLIDQIRDEGVRAIFPESVVDPRLERAVAREAGARVGESLWADSLGPEGSSGETYLEAMAADTRSIVSGLSGQEVTCELPR